MKIKFDCGSEEFDVFINGEKRVEDALFRDYHAYSYSYANQLAFTAHNDNDDGGLEFYVDAVGYSTTSTKRLLP